jgi:glycosyltransferase 2 family protein
VKLSALQKIFQGPRMLIPIGIGLLTTYLLVARNFDFEPLLNFHWGITQWMWFLAAIVMVALRDIGYILRLRWLSDKLLTWKQSFQLTFLWEFASAVSPGIVGGTAAAFVLLGQEKISKGKTTAIVMLTAFLDTLFYIVTVPIVILFTGLYNHIPEIQLSATKTLSTAYLANYFLISYVLFALWGGLVYYGIFHKPQIIAKIIRLIFRLPLLNKWRENSYQWAGDLIVASKEYRQKNAQFWMRAILATFLSWMARFAVVNCLIMIFNPVTAHLELYIRQLIMWGILLIPVTPGASGLAEILFPAFLRPYFPNITFAKITSLLWRLISYYTYLFIGVVIFPIWLKRISKKG